MLIGGKPAVKYGSKIYKKVPKSTVTNALKNFKSKKMSIGGSNKVLLDKSAMKHILERHHPKYWTGYQDKTMFNPKLSINDIQNMIVKIVGNNKAKIKSGNGYAEINTTVNGKKYRLIIKKYRITSFYPR